MPLQRRTEAQKTSLLTINRVEFYEKYFIATVLMFVFTLMLSAVASAAPSIGSGDYEPEENSEDRTIYTAAEAAQDAEDGNDNTVTISF